MANEPPTPPKLPHESTETLSLTGDLDLEKQLQDNSSSAGPNSSTGVVSEKGSVGPHVLSLDEAASQSSRFVYFSAGPESLSCTRRGELGLGREMKQCIGWCMSWTDGYFVADPRNWSTQRKIIYNIILCTWVLALTYASTAYVCCHTVDSDAEQCSEKFLVADRFGPRVDGSLQHLSSRCVNYSTLCGDVESAS